MSRPLQLRTRSAQGAENNIYNAQEDKEQREANDNQQSDDLRPANPALPKIFLFRACLGITLHSARGPFRNATVIPF